MRIFLTIALGVYIMMGSFLYAAPVHAFSMEENSDGSTRTIVDFIEDYVNVPEGGTSWRIFGQAQEEKIETVTEDGFDVIYTKPIFSDEIAALDGKEITLKGYMFPLGNAEKQTQFLFGPFPISCPYHYHVGPSLVMEVHADKNPIAFDYEAVTVKGTLELVLDDPEYSLFYRLKHAKKI